MKLVVKGLSIVFSAAWFLYILLEYWVQHPEYSNAIRIFSFQGHLLKLLVMGGLGIGGLWYFRTRRKIRWINGLTISVLAIVYMVIMADDFYEVYFGQTLSSPEKLQFILSMCGAVIPVFLILMVCYVLGWWWISCCSFKVLKADADIIAVGLGIGALMLIMFFLGALHLLNPYVMIPLLVLIIGIGWRRSLLFLRTTLIEPNQGVRHFGWVGFVSFYVVFIVICMNMITVVRPMALGYDAMTLYMKLSALIHDYKGLVQGNLPYNWSLFISLGYVLMDSLPMTMTLCFSASILCLFALYRLARKWLEPDYSMLCVMLFATMPMTNWLAYMDMKTDLGLLFLLLLILLLLAYWIYIFRAEELTDVHIEGVPEPKEGKKKGKKVKSSKKATVYPDLESVGVLLRLPGSIVQKLTPEQQILTLLGILMGTAIGIKISAIMIVFPVIAVLWYVSGDILAFFAATVLGLFFVLVAGLDEKSGLGSLHLTAGIVEWILFAGGAFGLLYFGLKHRQQFINLLQKSLILLLCVALPMLPWLVKNYSESRSLSVSGLTQGRNAQPVINIDELRKISATKQDTHN